jgi:ATP-dependent protease HslVU (ClpYQ) peptidase subunit
MTTIVAIQGESFAVVGTDSRISTFDDSGFAYQVTTLGNGTGKVAANGKYLIGVAGDVRAINIVHHAFAPPQAPPNLSGNKLDVFMTKTFIPALRATFEEQGYANTKGDSSAHIAEQDSSILVAVNGSIYVIESDYGWTSDRTGVYAIGTGGTYALGALAALTGKKTFTSNSAKGYIVKALGVAAKFDPYTGAPFQTFVQERKS